MSDEGKPALIHQGYRYALDPTMEQEMFLSMCAGASRYWFNQGLDVVKTRLNEREQDKEIQVPWSYTALCSVFKGEEIKNELAPWRAEVVTGSFQAGLEGLGNALQNFSRGKADGRQVGFPKFKAKDKCQESIIWQKPRIPDNRHVDLDKRLGPIRSKESMRKLTRLLEKDEHARVLRSTVQKTSGGWVISFSVIRSQKQRRAKHPNQVVGVDLGLKNIAILSTGQIIENARPLQKNLRKLARLQRQLDRQRRANNPDNYFEDGRAKSGCEWVSSQRMLLTEQRIRKLHARVSNIRREQAHAITTYLVRNYGVIGVESLAVSNMVRNRKLARAISDVGWGLILQQLQYKTDWSEGSMLVEMGRFYPSSKTCSGCGCVKTKQSLSERTYTCVNPACGLVLDRDLNASLNMAQQASTAANNKGKACQGWKLCFNVAQIDGETLNGYGGYVSLLQSDSIPVETRVSISPLTCQDPLRVIPVKQLTGSCFA